MYRIHTELEPMAVYRRRLELKKKNHFSICRPQSDPPTQHPRAIGHVMSAHPWRAAELAGKGPRHRSESVAEGAGCKLQSVPNLPPSVFLVARPESKVLMIHLFSSSPLANYRWTPSQFCLGSSFFLFFFSSLCLSSLLFAPPHDEGLWLTVSKF